MIKRNKAILCALASIGIMTSVGTVKANAMTITNNTNTTTKCIYKLDADQVERLLCKLPYTIDTHAKEQFKTELQIIFSRMAYNSLSPQEQSRVDEDLVYDLERDEALLHRILGDEVKALGIVGEIVKLDNEVNSAKRIDNKQELLDKINDIYNARETLDYSIRYSTGLSHFMSKLNQIQGEVLSK